MAFLDALRMPSTLFRVSGIPVRADKRWFVVLLLLTIVSTLSINSLMGNLIGSFIFGLAVVAAFFASIFLHEYAHAFAARLEKLEVVEIVLHPFGGLTRFRHEPETPRAEFRIAVAGPAASLVLAVFFGVPAIVANYSGTDILGAVLALLSLSNLLLCLFNLLPGYPLDGGRVLRAYLWRSGRELNAATLTTGFVGQIIAAGLAILGIAVMLRGQIFTGLWAVIVGFFLFDSASSIIKDVKRIRRSSIDPLVQLRTSLPRDMPLMRVVDNVIPMHPHTTFPVAEDREVYGILVMDDVKQIAREKWRELNVGDVMRVISEDKFVEMGTSCEAADELLRINEIGALCVTDREGKLVGFLSGRIRSGI